MTAVPLFLRHSVQFQKSVNGLRLVACRLRHSLGSTSSRCGKPKLRSLSFKKLNDRINRGCLTRTRTSGQNKESVAGCLCHSFLLHLIQNSVCFFLNHGDSFPDQFFILRAENIQLTEHSGCVQLQIIILTRINNSFPVFLF